MIPLDHKSTVRRCEHARTARCAALMLFSLLGVLAFLFSAVSPEDDDLQQEFVQVSKARRTLVRECKSIPAIEVQGKNRIAPVAVLRVPFYIRHFLVGLVVVPGFQSRREVFNQSITGRSPPCQVFS